MNTHAEETEGPVGTPAAGPRTSQSRFVWAFTVTLAVAAGISLVRLPTHQSLVSTSWGWSALVLLAALFAAVEVFSVHLHFTRNSHSFSLFEIPLTLGLFFAPTSALIGAHVVGGGLILLLHRRQPPVKVLFNVAGFVLADQVAIGIFRAVAGSAYGLSVRSTVGATAGTLSASVVSALLVMTVISMVEQRWFDRRLVASVGFGAVTATISTSLGLIAVAMLIAYPAESWLLLVPTLGLYLANHAYVSERRQHQGIEFLHDSTLLLHQSPELESAMTELLTHARDTFHAGFAEVVYRPHGQDRVLHARTDGTAATATTVLLAGSGLEAVLDRFEHDIRSAVVDPTLHDDVLRSFLNQRGLSDAVIAPLQNEGRSCGVFVIGNRLGDVARFDRQDLMLLETLAANVTVALENGHLEQSLDQLRQLERKLTHQANHDALTGLANRSLFSEQVTDALAGALPRAGSAAVLFLDLDDFKTVNDSLGHAAGDELLVILGRRLMNATPAGGVAARLGGDEFAILIPQVADADEAGRIAHELLHAVSTPVSVAGRPVPVNASIGVALSAPGQSVAELLRNADTAMYAAKGRGKQCVALFEDSLHEAAVHRYNLKFELTRALTDDEFVVHYQPIVALADATVLGAEALVRWQHPTLGLLTPGAFIPIAEESGAILAIGRVVLERVCRFLASADPLGATGDPLYVSVNLSARDLLEPTLTADLMKIIDNYSVDPRRLVFEITEGLLIDDTDIAVRTLHSLKDIGARIALDDFGTGYSSLSQLYRLPVDILKIAQPFIDDLASYTTPSKFVEAIIQIGQTLGLITLAEGIEHVQQAEHLVRMGCQLGQGYHYSPPVPEAIFRERVAAHTQAEPVADNVVLLRRSS